MGYSPLQLATGKAVMIHGLTMENIATETMTDAEAVKYNNGDFDQNDCKVLKDWYKVEVEGVSKESK